MIKIAGKYTTATIMVDEIEETAKSQITHFVNHPAFTNPIVIMPDTHAGKGSVIGFTMPLNDKVIPNVIGVDIGCGMTSLYIGKKLNLSLEQLDYKIRQRIPFGMDVHDDSFINMEEEFPWHEANIMAEKFAQAYYERFGPKKFNTSQPFSRYDMKWFMDKCGTIGGGVRRIINSLGTLGGGNHFIETGIGKLGYYITIHSGSRNFGKRICDYWQNKAVKFHRVDRKSILQDKIKNLKATEIDNKVLFEKIKKLKTEVTPNVDMKGCEWLEGADAAGYLYDMVFAQIYAQINRKIMANIIMGILEIPRAQFIIETIHNFIDFQDFIIRKGAIRSYMGENMVIPFNMRDGILICDGKSNPDWNFSAPHGAGRLMGRAEAKRKLNTETFKEQMKGIYSTSVGHGTLDESPSAYKDAKFIEKAIQPTATILDRIRPIHNMKDSDGEID